MQALFASYIEMRHARVSAVFAHPLARRCMVSAEAAAEHSLFVTGGALQACTKPGNMLLRPPPRKYWGLPVMIVCRAAGMMKANGVMRTGTLKAARRFESIASFSGRYVPLACGKGHEPKAGSCLVAPSGGEEDVVGGVPRRRSRRDRCSSWLAAQWRAAVVLIIVA